MPSWIPFYAEVMQALAGYENRQAELINLLHKIERPNSSTLSVIDEDIKLSTSKTREIDPFTFLAHFHCSNDKSRLAMWNVLKNAWDLVEDVPNDLRGLPMIHEDNCWFTPHGTSRNVDDTLALWRLFQEARQTAPSSFDGALWERAIQIGGLGVTKMSNGLFWVNPQNYLSLDRWMVKYLTRSGVSPDVGAIRDDWDAYIEMISQVHEKIGSDHVGIAREAWSERDTLGVANSKGKTRTVETSRRYWAGGHDWSTGSQLERFREKNEWQLGYSEQTGTPVANRLIKLFSEVAVGDVFAIKGSNFKHLKVHYLGRVRAVDATTRTLQLDALEEHKLYVGNKPVGAGAGNWTESLLEVKRPEDIALIFGAEEDTDEITPSPTEMPLNVILYGPPGTGKTYNTISRAVEIIDNTELEREESVERFEKLREQHRIGFVTFHQSYAYEEFIEGLRPDIDESSQGGARYRVRAGTLKTMAMRALGACLEAAEPGRATFEEIWSAFEQKVEENAEFVLPGIGSSQYKVTFMESGNVKGDNIKGNAQQPYNASRGNIEKAWAALRGETTATHNAIYEVLQKGSHTNLIGAIIEELKRLEAKSKSTPKVSVDPLAAAQSFLSGLPDYRLKNEDDLARVPRFVLIVDEINRGNISKILGELITLLEDDKRLGRPNALRVILPYSSETFALPPNLYLLGTMNTADKSLALLDVALRRRFHFEEMAPNFSTEICPDLPSDMRAVLEELNRRLLRVLDREHRLGHAFFIKVRDVKAFNDVFHFKIVPLLQEFFYNDWEGLRAVLGETGAGKIVRELKAIDGVRGRNSYGWWNDLDEATPNFLAALLSNYNLNKLNAAVAPSVSPTDAAAEDTASEGA